MMSETDDTEGLDQALLNRAYELGLASKLAQRGYPQLDRPDPEKVKQSIKALKQLIKSPLFKAVRDDIFACGLQCASPPRQENDREEAEKLATQLMQEQTSSKRGSKKQRSPRSK